MIALLDAVYVLGLLAALAGLVYLAVVQPEW